MKGGGQIGADAVTSRGRDINGEKCDSERGPKSLGGGNTLGQHDKRLRRRGGGGEQKLGEGEEAYLVLRARAICFLFKRPGA